MVKNLDDVTFVLEAMNGDSRQFGKLVERYSGFCHAYFIRQWRLDFETAGDLSQEAFCQAFKCLSQLKQPEKFRSWLLIICRNLALRRKNQASRRFPPPDKISDSPHVPVLQRIILGEALATLPDRQKEIVEMKYLWDFSCKEIAVSLGIPEGTVKSELFHARVALAKLLGKEDT